MIVDSLKAIKAQIKAKKTATKSQGRVYWYDDNVL